MTGRETDPVSAPDKALREAAAWRWVERAAALHAGGDVESDHPVVVDAVRAYADAVAG